MRSAAGPSLAEQRQILRGQLQLQRQQIALQIECSPKVNSDYPRSMTMRFLTQQSGLISGLLAGVATLLAGPRFYRSTTAVMTLIRIARSILLGKSTRRPALPALDDKFTSGYF
jgi:hypothetical protein